VDLRRGHDGLIGVVKNVWGLTPFSGHLFVFPGKRRVRAEAKPRTQQLCSRMRARCGAICVTSVPECSRSTVRSSRAGQPLSSGSESAVRSAEVELEQVRDVVADDVCDDLSLYARIVVHQEIAEASHEALELRARWE
jgi:hypothetical protein